MKIECPTCKKDFLLSEVKTEYHKLGRSTVCPKCGKKVILLRVVREPKKV